MREREREREEKQAFPACYIRSREMLLGTHRVHGSEFNELRRGDSILRELVAKAETAASQI